MLAIVFFSLAPAPTAPNFGAAVVASVYIIEDIGAQKNPIKK
jgi:hypothetical protein